MPIARNGEIFINYQVEGEGRSIVLLHSYLSDYRMWYDDGYVEYLSKNNKVIAIDIRGFGKSSKPHESGAYAEQYLVGDVLAVLNQESLQKTIVYGYSMGGRIAYACLKHAPDRITSAIVGGMHPYELDDLKPLLLEQNKDLAKGWDYYIDKAEQRVGEFTDEYKQMIHQNDPKAIIAFNEYLLEMTGFSDETLKNITCPVLLYSGTEDKVINERLKQVSTLIPNSVHFEIPGANHQQAFMQKEIVLPRVDEFLFNNPLKV
ncbi:MAG: alpha/beta fold hydrolase [Candidatus Hodarchaeales archaeon]|jgi:pimeloyl-ACP methyl ester carboxylesterase